MPNAELSYLTAGAFNGDAGDPMTGYDRFGRTTRMPWKNGGTVLADIAYGYDRASRRTWRQDLTPAAQAAFDRAYGYDALGQVKAADRGTLNENRTAIGGVPQEAEAWQYDEQGNWLAYDKAEGGASVIDQTRRSNVSNQIVTIDGSNEGVAYDKNGNMIRIPTGDALTGAPRKLVWNAWDQLVEVRIKSSNALVQRNAYDGLFRRTTRTFPAAPSGETVIHQYYNDQWKPIEERKDSATTALNVYYWGARPGHRDDLIRRDRDANGDGTLDEPLWCLMDYFDPMAILNSSCAVQERYAYSAFGIPLILAPDFIAHSSTDFGWDFLFHGQFTDLESGYQNYGYRFYLPVLGLWLSRDPIDEEGGSNLFVFSQNDPNSSIDLFGLQSMKPAERKRPSSSTPQKNGPLIAGGCGVHPAETAPKPDSNESDPFAAQRQKWANETANYLNNLKSGKADGGFVILEVGDFSSPSTDPDQNYCWEFSYSSIRSCILYDFPGKRCGLTCSSTGFAVGKLRSEITQRFGIAASECSGGEGQKVQTWGIQGDATVWWSGNELGGCGCRYSITGFDAKLYCVKQ
ncbi:MAG: RHS repeat-associated core domain-containing protein [Verrucomicrobiales bacterium]|nr:RHS repeat-associated core domain-containing protein [Verrucomicrobiales bacterium]